MSVAIRIPVFESSQPGEARRAAVALAERLGFDETMAGRVAIVVTEGATNLIKHGGGGEILLHTIESGHTCGLEVLALDRGRGIADIAKSLRDGESTAGTPGSGLGAIVRLSASHDLYSQPGRGTAVLARFWPSKPPVHPAAVFAVEGFSVALRGEEVSGDDWAVFHRPTGCSIFVVDGLGHGIGAADAASAALAAFKANTQLAPVECMEAIHARLRGTRGAAAALATIDVNARTLSFVGVGNVAGVILDSGGSRNLVSMSGTMGHNVRIVREFSYPWGRQAQLVMHSDGVSGKWELSSYPGLSSRPLVLQAAVLYRDMARGNDDATVVMARESVHT